VPFIIKNSLLKQVMEENSHQNKSKVATAHHTYMRHKTNCTKKVILLGKLHLRFFGAAAFFPTADGVRSPGPPVDATTTHSIKTFNTNAL